MEPTKRFERERRASRTVHRDIPDILRGSPRAQSGIAQSRLVADPAPVLEQATSFDDAPRNRLTIRLQPTDALQAAARISARPYAASKRTAGTRASSADSTPNVAVHSMASLARPGGGFLTGANGQEEFLCSRTTLFASLDESRYPLPERGGVYTPDVLVFRNTDGVDLPKRERFFVDIITAGVPRHPDPKSRPADDAAPACSCGVSYCDRDRDLMLGKMKAVLRMAQAHGRRQLILGDWGCGPQRHPVREVATLWRKVLVGGARQRKPNAEQWEGLQEVIFAIPNTDRAREFRKIFEDVLAPDYPSSSRASSPGRSDAELSHLLSRATDLELQIDLARSTAARSALRAELTAVREQLALGRARASAGDDGSSDEDVEDDYVVSGYPASDGEDGTFYRISATTTSDSDSDALAASRPDLYTFRFGTSADPALPTDDDSDIDDLLLDWRAAHPSPKMDQDGWFSGSIDELSAHLHAGRKSGASGSISPRSPLVRCASGTTDEGELFDGLLSRFQRTGMS